MTFTKNLLFTIFALAIISLVSCEDADPCDGKVCIDGQVLDALTCNCIDVAPCEGKTCPIGEFLDVNTCDCVSNAICNGKTCEADETLNINTCECDKNDVVVSGTITTDATWTSDRIYELAGKVVVDNGATLTIEPGALIKGREGNGSLASALIIARGSMINACGTADAPIIFTSELDDISLGEKIGSNLNENSRELWGGLIVLGAAPISAKDGDTETQIEGIPADETYGLYGGDQSNDNSGSLCYISIRHGGALIGADNEINGLTLGGVGAGTSINNIEVVANLDDGIEFFGGTVNVENALVAYQGDDAIDIDMNYSGTINNVYIIHGGDDTDEAFEIDGPENSTYTEGKFTITNATAIATDDLKTSGADLKSKAQGLMKGVSWRGYKVGKAVAVRASFNIDDCSDKSDTYTNVVAGDMVIMSSEYISEEASDADITRIYTDPKSDDANALIACLAGTDYEDVLDSGVASMSNTVKTSPQAGAVTSEFDWTWAASKGFVQ